MVIPRLYTYFRSSASFRVRIALNLKGVEYQSVPVHLVKDGGQQLQAAYRRINPDGLVPAFADFSTEGSDVLTQSLAIMEYLEERFPEPPLLPPSAEGRAFVRSIALQIACDIHPVNNLRVLKYLTEKLEISDTAKHDWYRHWIHLGFDSIENKLAKNPAVGDFVFGDTPGFADVCLVPQVWNAQRFQIPLGVYPTLLRLFDNAMSIPAFADAAPSRQADADETQ
ncbi:maleylacetoacetate isomerase [Burkholderia sp. Ch1-1]|nr:maleylacetoacetate isomerase [Burkholderia sp. Ch1-1]